MDFGDSRLARATDTRVPFAGVSLALRLSGSLVLLGQLDAHANPYTAPALDDPAVALWGTLGVRWLPTRRWRLEGAFSEDLAVDSAPDITFILSVSRDF